MSESSPAPAVTGPRAPRWLWIALIASLALNFLVLGVVARSMWHHPPPGGDRIATIGLVGYVRSLPAERREELRRIMEQERPRLRPLRQELRQLRGELMEILRTDPLDKVRLTAAQTRILDSEIEMRRIINQTVATVAERMTPEERRALASWRDGWRGGGPRRRGPGDEEKDATGPPKQP
jgi:uncharacterized membrane protein